MLYIAFIYINACGGVIEMRLLCFMFVVCIGANSSSILDMDSLMVEEAPIALVQRVELGLVQVDEPIWEFFSIIMLPPLPCVSISGIAPLFQTALRHVNPGQDDIQSIAIRFGADVCVDGTCFCEDSESVYLQRVLEVRTWCYSRSLFLPLDEEFPFPFDARGSL